MKTRTILYADNGKILTNGEVYGKQIFLAEGDSGLSYYEIDEKDYQEKIEKQIKES